MIFRELTKMLLNRIPEGCDIYSNWWF